VGYENLTDDGAGTLAMLQWSTCQAETVEGSGPCSIEDMKLTPWFVIVFLSSLNLAFMWLAKLGSFVTGLYRQMSFEICQ